MLTSIIFVYLALGAYGIANFTTAENASLPLLSSANQRTMSNASATNISSPITQKTTANASATSSPGATPQKATRKPYVIKTNANRIVGGTRADTTPFIVSLVVRGSPACAGAIISKNFVLTAAHCCGYSVFDMKLRAGSSNRLSGGTMYEVAQSFKHEYYDKDTTANDICLIRPKKPIVFTLYVQPILMCASDTVLFPGDTCTAVGWGRTSEGGKASDILLMAVLQVIDIPYCQKVYGENLIGEGNFCAGDPDNWSKDTCQGDSGGPIICSGCLCGVVSWGIGCARLGNPGVYTLVPYYAYWIASNTGIMSGLSQRTRTNLLEYNSTLMRPVQMSIN